MSNNITKQVITELETIKAIASELADMSPRTQMEIVALCKEICLNVDKVLEKHDIDITTLFNYVQTIESELEEIRELIDPQHLALIDERLEELEASILTINESIGGINQTLSTHTNQIQGLETNKQNVLTAGANIQINNGVISATDTTYTAGENITIENGVISASGGSVTKYRHNVNVYRENNKMCLNFTIINNDNTPITYNALVSYLIDNYFTTAYNGIEASGSSYDGTYIFIIRNIYYQASQSRIVAGATGFYVENGLIAPTATLELAVIYSSARFTDTIVEL